MSDQIVKLAFNGFSKYLFPIFKNFITKKYKEKKLKELRTSKTGRITCILLCKKGGKSFMTDYISNLELDNIICIDLDSSNILKTNYEYDIQLKNIGSDYDILLLPEKLKILNKLQQDFNKKSIVVLTSDYNLGKYLNENEFEVLKYLPSLNYYQVINNTLTDADKVLLFKSYNNILKMNNDYKVYSSQEELREMIKLLFI